MVTATLMLALSTPAFAADDDRSIALPAERPAALPALYVSLAALQAFDGYSTTRALSRGGQELNPVIGSFLQQPVAFWSLKAASTGVSIYYAERLWRQRRRTEAIAVMVAVNVMMGVVGARNASVLSKR